MWVKNMNQKSIIITVLVVLIILFSVWYLYYNYSQQSQQGYTQPNDDTTAGILNDLNQIPDDSSIDSEMNSLNQDIQNF